LEATFYFKQFNQLMVVSSYKVDQCHHVMVPATELEKKLKKSF